MDGRSDRFPGWAKRPDDPNVDASVDDDDRETLPPPAATEGDEEPFPLIVRRDELGPPLRIMGLVEAVLESEDGVRIALPFTRLDVN